MSGAFLAGEAILNPATGCKFPLHLIVCRQAGLTFRQHGPCLCAVFMCIPAALRAPWARLKLGGRGGGESGRQKVRERIQTADAIRKRGDMLRCPCYK